MRMHEITNKPHKSEIVFTQKITLRKQGFLYYIRIPKWLLNSVLPWQIGQKVWFKYDAVNDIATITPIYRKNAKGLLKGDQQKGGK